MDGLSESGFLLQAIVAFGGGIVSFISPCVLPLLPGYLAMMSGYSTADLAEGRASTRRLLGKIGLFILGNTTTRSVCSPRSQRERNFDS